MRKHRYTIHHAERARAERRARHWKEKRDTPEFLALMEHVSAGWAAIDALQPVIAAHWEPFTIDTSLGALCYLLEVDLLDLYRTVANAIFGEVPPVRRSEVVYDEAVMIELADEAAPLETYIRAARSATFDPTIPEDFRQSVMAATDTLIPWIETYRTLLSAFDDALQRIAVVRE